MNLLEGARRMQLVGKIANLTAIGLIVLCVVAGLILSHTNAALSSLGSGPISAILAVGGCYLLAGGALLWVAGFILEGFALPRTDGDRALPTPRDDRQQSAL